MKKTLSLLMLALTVSQLLVAQALVSFDLQKNSLITIHGSTNLLSFELQHSGSKLLKRSYIVTATQLQNRITLSQNQLSISVNNFTSVNKMALRDFLKLMKSDLYPTMLVQLKYIELQSPITNVQNLLANAFLNITITGVTKQYCIPIKAKRDGEFYTVDGKKSLSIRDFGLVPPVEFMGMIRVSEWIDIDFHIISKINSYSVLNEANNPKTHARETEKRIDNEDVGVN